MVMPSFMPLAHMLVVRGYVYKSLIEPPEWTSLQSHKKAVPDRGGGVFGNPPNRRLIIGCLWRDCG
jgi:hypothetical protein